MRIFSFLLLDLFAFLHLFQNYRILFQFEKRKDDSGHRQNSETFSNRHQRNIVRTTGRFATQRRQSFADVSRKFWIVTFCRRLENVEPRPRISPRSRQIVSGGHFDPKRQVGFNVGRFQFELVDMFHSCRSGIPSSTKMNFIDYIIWLAKYLILRTKSQIRQIFAS